MAYRRLSATVAVALTAAIAACESDTTTPVANPGPTAATDPPPPPPSSNVIDVAIWPRLVRDGTTSTVSASNAELCRRMSLDLTGTVPSPSDVASACVGKTPQQMADAFMSTPEFASLELRLWIQVLGEDPTNISAYLLRDADPIIGRLATGAAGYDDFVAQIVAHPVMALDRRIAVDDLTDISKNVLRIFLGRTPVGGEALDFANLFRPWRREKIGDPSGVVGYRPFFAALDPTQCSDAVYGAVACTSTLLGPKTTVQLPDNPAGSGCYNYLNLGDHTGHLPGPPDGLYCYFSFDGKLASVEDAAGNVAPTIQKELEKPGRLLATRADFWEQEADRALSRYLGWWKSSSNEPDTVLPEVRTALGSWFARTAGHDIRKLYSMIVTSLLYTRAVASEGPSSQTSAVVPWLRGPMKAMTGEQYLDSAIKALKRTGASGETGPCDPHVSSEGLAYVYYYPKGLRIPTDASSNYYRDRAAELGACGGGSPSQSTPGLGGLFSQVGIGQTLCDDKAVLAPAGFVATDTSDANMEALVSYQFEALLTREPDDAEISSAKTLAQSCLADKGCGDLQAYSRELCQTLLRAGSFTFY